MAINERLLYFWGIYLGDRAYNDRFDQLVKFLAFLERTRYLDQELFSKTAPPPGGTC